MTRDPDRPKNQCCNFGVDPDPAIFVIGLQDPNKKQIFKSFSAFTFLRYIYIIFQRQKVKKKS